MMKRVLVIGGGFAGLSAVAKLRPAAEKLKITLIDKRKEHNFLPMLPDVIGRGVSCEYLLYSLEELSQKSGIEFIQAEVTALELEKNRLKAGVRTLDYDYLIIASGTETNFYGQAQIARYAYKLDSARDAENIIAALKQQAFAAFVIAGGGYTGIEVAANLRRYFDRIKKDKKIAIVELGPSLLGPLPDWIKDYVAANLQRLNIDVHLNASINRVEGDKVYLSNAKAFDKAMLIWTAGVKTGEPIFNLNLPKTRQGRLRVDEYLRVNRSCFAAGDAADFSFQGRPLRMAVQFSITQGRSAAANILREMRGLPLRKYRPIDLGYIIPMANNQSCGIILGLKTRGLLASFLHYCMCIYRSYTLKNKLGIMKLLRA